MRVLALDTTTRAGSVAAYLDYVDNFEPAKPVVGFKMMASHILKTGPVAFLGEIIRRRYVVLYLHRANLFENCISLHLSKASRNVQVERDSSIGCATSTRRFLPVRPGSGFYGRDLYGRCSCAALRS